MSNVLRNAMRFSLAGTRVKGDLILAEDLCNCDYDEHQIAQVIDNLLINAVQAMPMGGILTVSAQNAAIVRHPTLADGDYVMITVEDQGVGIPASVLPRIFDPYFTTKQAGSGLGLATAFSIVRRHDGTIEVASVPDQGSTFRVYLPASSEAESRDSAHPARTHQGAGLVLVMDDEATIRSVLRQMLDRLGYGSLCAEDEAQAIAYYEQAREGPEPLVCAILDLTIAGGPGGLHVKQCLRDAGAKIPIFAMSGYSDDPVISEPASFGFKGSLAKPFTIASVSHLMSTLDGDGDDR